MLRFIFECFRLLWVMAREGVIALLPLHQAPFLLRVLLTPLKWLQRSSQRDNDNKNTHTALVNALERMGPSYIKMGQFLATRPDIIGLKLAQQLSVLQDQMPAFSMELAYKQIEKEFGKPWSEIFDDISKPVAAASVAQVHKAIISTNENSQTVAIKILRPNVEKRFRRDIRIMRRFAKMIEYFIPSMKRLKPADTVDLMQSWIRHELDLRLEAGALSEFAQYTENDENIRVPKLDWLRSGKTILTAEWIDGCRVDDHEGLKQRGVDPHVLGDQLLSVFLTNALKQGFFHADMHAGNLLVDDEGRLVVLDFGIMGRISSKERRFLAEILYGFVKRDYMRVAEVHFQAGYVPANENVADFAQALRAVGEPIHDRQANQISMAKLLGLLFEITDIFNMQTRLELLLLQKTMVAIEGLSRSLNPDFNMWKVSEPILKQWMIQNLGIEGKIKDITGAMRVIAERSENLPQKLNKAFDTLDYLIEKEKISAVRDEIKTALPQKKENKRGFLLPLSIILLSCSITLLTITLLKIYFPF